MKNKIGQNKGNIIIYKGLNGPELQVQLDQETVWLSQKQIADLFEKGIPTINEHISNIYREGELLKGSTIRNFRIVQTEGKRAITRTIELYSLDMVLSVGYRVNSKQATKFRQWATKTLKEYIVKGYAINRKQIANNYNSFMKAVHSIQSLLPATNSEMTHAHVLELISTFADTWFSLDAYDRGSLKPAKTTKKKITLQAYDLRQGIDELKKQLVKRREANEIFAQERSSGNLEGIIGNVMQSFGGKELYPSLEEKSAHLLYFMIKNHPFTDGNKRSAAFAFVWFLRRAGLLNLARLTPSALTSLTLLIAESNPKDKDKMIGLVVMLLGR